MDNCFLNWCFLPVIGFISIKVALEFLSKTLYLVLAFSIILFLPSYLIRHEGKKKIIEKSKTNYKVIDKNSNCSLLKMNPITGRKHQLRKQLSIIGHPIYGDFKYTFEKKFKTKNKELMLHSYEIKFIINKQKYTFKALLPNYFKELIRTKRLRFLN